METLKAIQTRRSVRVYENRPVEKAVLEEVLQGALMAPSWKNTQTAGYLVVEHPELSFREKLMACFPSFNARIIGTAPVIVVMTTKRGRSGYERDGSFSTQKGDRWEMFDAGIACQTLCLAAWDRGIASCIMGIYDEQKLPALLQVPEDESVTAVVALGYPAEAPACPKRKTLEEKVRYV